MKLLNIVSEGKRIKLEPEVNALIHRVSDIIYKKRNTGFKTYTPITSIPIVVQDGTPGTVEIAVDPNLQYFGLLDQKVEDSKDPNDFILTLNPNKITSKKNLYLTLYHEVMHATDPGYTTKYSEKYWKDYDPEIDEKYWAHPIEFRASTNEFSEGLRNEFQLRKKRLKNADNLKYLIKSADNILEYFAKGTPLSKLSYDILEGMSGLVPQDTKIAKLLQDMIIEYPQTSEFTPKHNKPPYYIGYIELIKKYDPTIWKRFLSTLHAEVQNIKENLIKSI
jgi:hypothetical protein